MMNFFNRPTDTYDENNQIAFKKEENPKLFDAIVTQLTCDFFDFPSHIELPKNFKKDKQVLSSKELDSIYSLEIGKSINEPLSLEGIEKLKNLNSLIIHTYSTDKAQSMLKYQYLVVQDNHSDNMLQLIVDKGEKLASTNQITDFSPLYKCKKLHTLKLPNQLNLHSLNLENFPYLRTLDVSGCTNLKKVSGFETLKVFDKQYLKELKDKKIHYGYGSKFNFFECDNLVDIEGLGAFVNFIDRNHFFNSQYEIVLPTTTYCHLYKRYPEAINILSVIGEDKKRDIFKWIESSSSEQCSIILNTSRMTTLRMQIDDIISSFNCDSQDKSELAEISRAYRWLTDNVHSDHYGVTKEEVYRPNLTQATLMRNSVNTLQDRKAVCVGISNALNLILAEMGYVAERCYCKEHIDGKDNQNNICDNFFQNDHQISKIHLTVNGETGCYYMDPTWDTTKKKSKFFLLNKDELQQSHKLGIGEKDEPNAKSIQDVLKQNKYLTSNYKHHNVARIKNKTVDVANRYKTNAFIFYIIAKQLAVKTKNKVKNRTKTEEKEQTK